MIKQRKPLKRSPLPPRKSYLKRSSKPIAREGKAKARRRKAYKAFLSSAKWKQLRRDAIMRACGRCEECKDMGWLDCSGPQYTFRGLEVDHVSYARFGGRELPEDLRVLCTSYHRRKHGAQSWKRRRFA